VAFGIGILLILLALRIVVSARVWPFKKFKNIEN